MRKCIILLFLATGAAFADSSAERVVPTQNEFLREAFLYSNLSRLALLDGDYDGSLLYSEEAIRYAELSDEYIRGLSRLTPALAEAEDLLRWAETSGALPYYPKEIEQAKRDLASAYTEKRAYAWDEALRLALLVKEDLREVAAPPPPDTAAAADNLPKNPAQYKVRPWDIYGDCLWNIAKWFYKDPWKWREIYAVNKDKLPEPDNPDWIEVGTVLDLPEIGDDLRAGFWDTGLPYTVR